jgi:molecular chaperone DnaK
LNAAVDNLTKASHRIAESLYKAQSAAGSQPGGAGPAGGNGGPSADGGAQPHGHGQGDVVDAEFVDVDESKKPN